MKILTAEQMRRIDARAGKSHGVSSTTLMDNAGRAVAELLLRLYPSLSSMGLLILCGKGNNGGDGLAAASHLKTLGVEARVVCLNPLSAYQGPSAHHRDEALRGGMDIEEASSETAWAVVAAAIPAHHALILDALLGTGLRGAARGLAARAIGDLNGSGAEVVALDIPSGLSGDDAGIPGPAVRAARTVALACPKIPHVFEPAAALCGALHVVDIGIPLEAVTQEGVSLNLIDESEMAAVVPVREADGHKGDYGRILVVGGSRGKSGAAALVAHAALRSGAGLVTAATSMAAQPILAAHVVEMMTEALPQTPDGAISRAAASRLRDLIQASDVLAVGPGLTTGDETAGLVREVVTSTSLPVVLDADGINAFAGRAGELRGDSRVLVLTPHPGEMARLLSRPGSPPVSAAQVQSDRVGAARAFSREHSCYLALKGHRTVVAAPDGQVWINPTGNPGMATAGSGDVLTGVIAGLMGQGLSPLEASLLGVYVHGVAGDLAAAEYGEISMTAHDIVDYLSDAFLQIERVERP